MSLHSKLAHSLRVGLMLLLLRSMPVQKAAVASAAAASSVTCSRDALLEVASLVGPLLGAAAVLLSVANSLRWAASSLLLVTVVLGNCCFCQLLLLAIAAPRNLLASGASRLPSATNF